MSVSTDICRISLAFRRVYESKDKERTDGEHSLSRWEMKLVRILSYPSSRFIALSGLDFGAVALRYGSSKLLLSLISSHGNFPIG